MIDMCRILMANKEFVNKTSKEEMLVFLDQLQKSCGGNGNGLAFVTKGEVVFSYKAIDLTNEDIVDMLYHKKTKKPDWFFYHTRVASAGSIKSENCHPYVNETNDFMLQMNGTERDFALLGRDRDVTDTQIIFEIYNKTGYDIASLRLLTPRFMGLSKGKVFATNPSSSPLKYYQDEDGAFAIASEFEATRDNVKTMKKTYVWLEGEEMQEEPVVAYSTNAYYNRLSNNNAYSAYNGYYYDYKNKSWTNVAKEEDCKACTVEEELEIEDYNGSFTGTTEQGTLSEIEVDLEDEELNSMKGFAKATMSEESFFQRLSVLEELCYYYLPDDFYADELVRHFFTSDLTVNREDGTSIKYDVYSERDNIFLNSSLETITFDKFGMTVR